MIETTPVLLVDQGGSQGGLFVANRFWLDGVFAEGVNDQKANAEELGFHFRKAGIRVAHVNLISYNPVEGCEFQRPSNNRVHQFKRWLEDEGVTVTYRISRGLEANAACGQLQHKHLSSQR